MPAGPPADFKTDPVEDTVPKVEDEIAVGEDLDFQRRWWKFERVVWTFFLLILVCDLLGLFGRGWLAKAKASPPDGALNLDAERSARGSTPSIMTLHLGQAAIHDGKIRIFISDSLVRPLGAQRVSPQPAESALADGGISYTFPATGAPATVQIALEPSFPGSHSFRIQVLGEAQPDTIDASVFVVP
jgi:hypothetical protein